MHRGEEIVIHPDAPQQVTIDVHAAAHWLYLKEKQKLELEWERLKTRQEAADASSARRAALSEIRTESVVGGGAAPRGGRESLT